MEYPMGDTYFDMKEYDTSKHTSLKHYGITIAK
jgi:hypothetical protein